MATKMKKADILDLLSEVRTAVEVLQVLDSLEQTVRDSVISRKYLDMKSAKMVYDTYRALMVRLGDPREVHLPDTTMYSSLSEKAGQATVVVLETIQNKKHELNRVVIKAIDLALGK